MCTAEMLNNIPPPQNAGQNVSLVILLHQILELHTVGIENFTTMVPSHVQHTHDAT